MRIIGGHDYYDGAMGYGQDPSIVFVRDRRLPIRKPPLYVAGAPDVARDYTVASVFFCGKRYNGIRLYDSSLEEEGQGKPDIWCWTEEQFHRHFVPPKHRAYQYYHTRHAETPADFFNDKITDKELQFLINNGITIAINDNPFSNIWRIDTAELKDYGFARAVNPFTAYQEISMWVGGVIPRQPANSVTISDEARIAKHGFDVKTSFRKPKIKRK